MGRPEIVDGQDQGHQGGEEDKDDLTDDTSHAGTGAVEMSSYFSHAGADVPTRAGEKQPTILCH